MLIDNVYFNRINVVNHTNWWEWDFYSKVCEIVSQDFLVRKYKFRIYLTDPFNLNPEPNDIVVFTSNEHYEIPNFIDVPFLTFKQYSNTVIEDKLYGLPLGLNYPIIHTPNLPISKRQIDICFLGQYENRSNRINTINFIKEKFKNFNILISSNEKSVIEYYLALSNSKITLSLDGGLVPEAYRFFESLRYGCITLANNTLLNLDIYKNAPFIPVDWHDFKNLENILSNTLDNAISGKLDDISYINKTYWTQNYSEEAQANFIIDKIHKKIYNQFKI
jgi:hypothetical protein